MSLEPLIDLGDGHTAVLLWREEADRESGVPAALIEYHGTCRTYITWVEGAGLDNVWRLESLRPLSLHPAVACPTCGQVGLLTEGRYIDITRTHRPLGAGGS